MQKKALLALLLVLTMMLSGCALIQKDMEVDRATEIIRVGDTVYTKGEIQDQVDNQLAQMSYLYYYYFGMSYDVTDAQNIADAQDAVIDSLVEQAVLNAKAKELGFDQMSDEDMDVIATNTDLAWQSDRDYVLSNILTGTELEGEELEAAIDAELDALGVTYDMELESQTAAYALQKLRASITDPVTVSDEELQTLLDERVASAMSTYETSPSSYGTSVNNGGTVYYRPAGYRLVKQILVKFSDEDQAVIDAMTASLNTASTAATQQQNVLNSLAVENVDELVAQVGVSLDPETGDVTDVAPAFTEELAEEVAAAVEELAKAQAQQAFFTQKVQEATDAAFANIDEEADDVLAQLADGADWDALSAEHNDDPGMMAGALNAETGYAVCEGFSGFDTAFTAAAMAIPEVGQWSDKTAGAYGYYIIQYTSEVEEGPVALDDVRDVLYDSALSTKQQEVYDAQVAAWVEEANPQIDRNALNK